MSPLQDVGQFFRSAAAAAKNIYKPSISSPSKNESSSATDSAVYKEQSMYSPPTQEDIV